MDRGSPHTKWVSVHAFTRQYNYKKCIKFLIIIIWHFRIAIIIIIVICCFLEEMSNNCIILVSYLVRFILFVLSKFMYCNAVPYDIRQDLSKAKDVVCKGLLLVFFSFIYVYWYYLFTIRWCSCYLTVTLLFPQVEQELHTLQELIRSHLTFRGLRGAHSHCTDCSSIYGSDYTVGICKLYLTIISYVINILKLW